MFCVQLLKLEILDETNSDFTIFSFDFFLGESEMEIIRNAFHTWEDNTCVSFQELSRQEQQEDFEGNSILVTNQRTG